MITCDPCNDSGLKCVSGACDCPCHGDRALREGRLYRAVISGSRHVTLNHYPIIRDVLYQLENG